MGIGANGGLRFIYQLLKHNTMKSMGMKEVGERFSSNKKGKG